MSATLKIGTTRLTAIAVSARILPCGLAGTRTALAKHLVQRNAYAGREIQRPDYRRANRHGDEPIGKAFVQFRRQSLCLAPEDQHHVARRPERRVPEGRPARGGKEERLSEKRQLAFERVPVRPQPQVDVLPVIE